MGGVRRLARQSLSSGSTPALADNWTTEETNTYVELTPATGAAAWGGTIANLDRDFTKTGSTEAALGALLTFVHKPTQLAGVIVKVAATYSLLELPFLELWSLDGAVWTKRRRVLVPPLARTGDVVVIELTHAPVAAAAIDAYWVTLAPSGTETLTWTSLHVYGVCNDDPVTPDCPPGTPPEDCAAPECGVDVEDWVCQDPPDEPDPAPPTDPFVLPPIPVKIPFPPGRLGCSASQPPFNVLRMTFGEIPTGGSVLVTAVSTQGITFVEGFTQTISAAGDLDWTVLAGFNFTPGPAQVFPTSSAWPAALGPNYPKVDPVGMVFTFQLRLAASAFETAGALLDLLMYWWTFGYRNTYVC